MEAPLNYLQRYVLRRIGERPGTMMFNLAKMFRLRRGIDLSRLAEALATSARSHLALKSVLHRDPDGGVVQLCGLDDDEIQVEIVRVSERNLLARRDSYVKPFDLYDEGLLDAIIFDCGENSYLLSNIHHLVCDGYSFPIILEDAHRVWNGETLEPDRYYEILARRAARSQMPVAVAARKFMLELVRSRSFVQLPVPDRHAASAYGAREFPIGIPDGFDARLASARVTRHHFFLSAAVLALARLTGCGDVFIDWVFHGRVTKEELRTVGAFMVDLPMVMSDVGTLTPDEILYAAKHFTFTGIKNAHAIKEGDDDELCGCERLTFIYQDQWSELMSPGLVRPNGPFAWMIEETIPLRPTAIAAENPFNVEIMERADRTVLFLEYDAGRYSPELVAAYADCFHSSIATLLEARQLMPA